ncbi:MAG: hypothetical protein L7U45_02105 [Alphaproteobacteria bacterium]|nr:hypothetical protein [Alphaproteobacteria bacterium]
MMRRFFTPLFLGLIMALFIAPQAATACGAPPALLTATPQKILAALEEDAAPYLAAMDTYSVAMEACYDGPLGPLELVPFVKEAERLSQNMASLRRMAEDRVRGNELDYEGLLSSALWADIEAMRVAASYATAWSSLAVAVRHVSAEDKKQALVEATKRMQQLTFEFKHPVLVQRAMYGLASTHIEGGRLAAAQDTLTRLRQSLARAGAPEFKQSVEAFYARITAPDYQPPTPLFSAAQDIDAPDDARANPLSGRPANDAVRLARLAVGEGRPADEIVALLEPALRGTPESARAALALIGRDQLLVQAMDYAPGPSLRVMRRAFADGQYGQLVNSWPDLKPYYPLLPDGLKRQVDYQMGVARLNLGALILAIDHLRAARQVTPTGAQAERLDKLIVLAQLTADKAPDAALIALAKTYHRKEKFIEIQMPIDAPPPTPAEVLDDLLDLRARIVLARQAAQGADWPAADAYLTGIGPDQPAYRLFLGMRVRLLAEAVKGRKKAGENQQKLRSTARGGHILYRLWRSSQCPPGCPTGNRLAVHQAAFETAFLADLNSTAFGFSWGGFVEDGGDIRPFIPQALDYVMARGDGDRLLVLLESVDEELAAVTLAHWKKHLRGLVKKPDLGGHYGFLRGLIDLQGRPQAVLLETLIEHDLARDKAAAALEHAETLAANFPRRPGAWFWRAAALQANQRGLEAARALSSLAQRTPADDPIGMGARLGLAAIFIDLERGTQACAMRQKIFSRPQAQTRWRDAVTAFPLLKDWQGTADKHCG